MIRRLLALDRDLLLIYLSNLLWGLGLYLYFYIQPLYVTQLGATPAQVGLTLGIGGLIVLLLYAPIGLWADRRGRKPVILAGWTLGTLATFAMALAPDWRWLIPALAAYYLSNFAVSVMNGYIAAKAPEHKQSEVFAIISSGPAIGSILAPALGGWIGTQFGLRTVYFCGAIVYTLSTLTLLCIRPQPAEIHANRASASKLLRDRRFLVHLFFIFIAFFAIDVGQVLAPKFLAEVRGYSVDQIGWLGTAGAIGIVILLLGLGKLPGEGQLALYVSLGLALVGLALLTFSPLFMLAFFAFFIGGSNRLIRPPTIARTARLLTPATLSFGLGLQQMAMQLGLSISPYTAGLLYAHNPSWPFYAGLLGLGMALLMMARLPSQPQRQTVPALQSLSQPEIE